MATKTKKEEIIDFTKPEKIDEKELMSLQSTIRTMDKLTDDVGRLEIQKYALLKAMDGVQSSIQDLRKSFQEKYNTDNINIQTGEISYPEEIIEDGKADKKD
tara:strand:+ start:844 stop:1149 length:306 start_codon:yes stop_codon:yes gene_type:complete